MDADETGMVTWCTSRLLAAASNSTDASAPPLLVPHRTTPMPLPRDLSRATLSQLGLEGADSRSRRDADARGSADTDDAEATMASAMRRELTRNSEKRVLQARQPRSAGVGAARCCLTTRRRVEYGDVRVRLLAETWVGSGSSRGFAFTLAEGDYWNARRTCSYEASSVASCGREQARGG